MSATELPPFTHIAISHVHLVTRARLAPVARMIVLTTADGKEFTFTRRTVALAGLPNISGVDEEGVEYAPPLVMTISHSGYLLSIVEQGDQEIASS